MRNKTKRTVSKIWKIWDSVYTFSSSYLLIFWLVLFMSEQTLKAFFRIYIRYLNVGTITSINQIIINISLLSLVQNFLEVCERLKENDCIQKLRCWDYRKDTEPLHYFLCIHLYHTSFRYLSITCNAYISCYIRCKKYIQIWQH